MPPAQRVKCLELLGKITEVALFTERREVVKVSDAAQVRAALLDSITTAIKAGADDVEYQDADELLREIEAARVVDEEIDEGAGPEEFQEGADLPGGNPPDCEQEGEEYTHSNPHNQSELIADPNPPT
jgi:hypothetical protein